MQIPDFLKTTFSSFVDDIIIFVIKQASDQDIHDAGYKLGKLLTERGKALMGEDFDNIEDQIQAKIPFLINGLHNGLNSDDDGIGNFEDQNQ